MNPDLRVTRTAVGECEFLARGGQGRVYRAPHLRIPGETGPFVYKEYKKKTYSITGLDHIAGFRRRLTPEDRAVLDEISVWPLRVVEGPGGVALGIVLHLIPDRYFHELRFPNGTTKRAVRDAQYLPQPPERLVVAGVPSTGLGDRFRICRDMSLAIGFLHKRQVCFGDISFRNVVFALDTHPCVRLVDCDAVRLRSQAAVVEQAHTPDWIPPEGSHPQSMSTDCYKLGLFVLRVLAPRALSGQNRDPQWADGVLDGEGRRLLRRALDPDPSRPRTLPKEWYAYFKNALVSRNMRTTAHPTSAA